MDSPKTFHDVHAMGKQLLDIWEDAFSGIGGPETDLPFSAMGRAASFGAAAYEACPMRDAAPVAMMQAFLQALADPSDARLDYLRAKNVNSDQEPS